VRRGKWLEVGAIAEEIPDSSASTLQNISGAERDAQVLRAIGLLSKNQARAILMHAVEEIPYGEIALAMDCREATVRKHVARARARLRTLLAQQEEPSHA
jgi:RNA polymerase sigma-70 factor (ECF subfamily)